jgi:site-specific recombinase XerD
MGNVVPWPGPGQTAAPQALEAAGADGLLGAYLDSLSGKAEGTVDAYRRVLRALCAWVASRPGADGRFHPDHFTRTALATYLAELGAAGYSTSHRARVKSAAAGFARWLIEERGLLRRNPARGVEVPAQPVLAPRRLVPDQRYVLRRLVDHAADAGDLRGEAIFALGYWAGCRVSDVAWLRTEDAHVGPKLGWLRVGHKGGKTREIDLINEARRPLFRYLQRGGRDPESPYVFASQRGARLTEAGIHHWLRALKARATKAEWDLIGDVTFHDLRHDFAHRAREAGWTLEEVAYYLGHVTKRGAPAIQTTARYTQVSREAVRDKLPRLRLQG